LTSAESGREVGERRDVADTTELRLLFHRLNNQMGIILAHAELLESKVTDAPSRARASQVVASALEAMGTINDLRQHLSPPSTSPDA
jgi:hypothetical protein